jgi:homopolymeric O-antigen transport system ATP-binding protein
MSSRETLMDTVIEIRNISKCYRLGEGARMYGSFRELLTGAFRSAPKNKVNGISKAADSFWALKGISLDVQQGDTVGVIGSNGAGKSTLLKIISRITDPSAGHIKVRGRIGSLLEVGTGFHPELTGRENIYLNGAILGMHKTEIDSNFDAIVGFAGIGAFLDTPVKRYSSGMYVRLAFSIAAHLDPEILIVDEVLAVGDVAFQKKCLGKMAEACSRARTVLFVSHNLAAVENICNRGVVLHRGEVAFDGTSKSAINFYLHDLEDASASKQCHVIDLSKTPNRGPKYHPYLKRLELFDQNDRPFRGDIATGSRLKALVYFNLETPCKTFDTSIAFDTLGGQRVCTAHSAYEPNRIHEERVGEQVFVCDIPALALVPGEYKVHVGLDISSDEVDWVEDATRITVTRSDFYGTGVVPTKGVFLMPNRWDLEPVREEVSI